MIQADVHALRALRTRCPADTVPGAALAAVDGARGLRVDVIARVEAGAAIDDIARRCARSALRHARISGHEAVVIPFTSSVEEEHALARHRIERPPKFSAVTGPLVGRQRADALGRAAPGSGGPRGACRPAGSTASTVRRATVHQRCETRNDDRDDSHDAVSNHGPRASSRDVVSRQRSEQTVSPPSKAGTSCRAGHHTNFACESL